MGGAAFFAARHNSVTRHFNVRFQWVNGSCSRHRGTDNRALTCASGRATTRLATPASRLRDAPGISHWFCRVRFIKPDRFIGQPHQLDNVQEKEPCSLTGDGRHVIVGGFASERPAHVATESLVWSSESVNKKRSKPETSVSL